MASGFKTRISSNCNPYGTVSGKSSNDVVAFKVYYAGAWYPHGPEARDMAIDIIHDTFPGVQVEVNNQVFCLIDDALMVTTGRKSR